MAIDWKSLGADVAKIAPILGTALGGPAGTAIGSLVAAAFGTTNDPTAISAAIAADPDAAVKLKQIEADTSVQLQQLTVTAAQNELAAQTAQVTSINTTMQAEAKADHWPTYTWRPLVGFCFAAYIASLIIAPYFGIVPVRLSPDETMAIGAVLGVTAWFRGKMQADTNVKADKRG